MAISSPPLHNIARASARTTSAPAAAPVAPPASPRLTTPAADFRLHARASSGPENELRRQQHIARHSFVRPDTALNLQSDPGIASVFKNREHCAIKVSSENFTEVRRALQQVMLERGEPCVFLNDDSMQDLLTGKGVVRNKVPASETGEYDGLLSSGGTLIFNHAEYAPAGLEAFNELMQRQMLDGKKLPNNVRILLLENVDVVSRPLTDAQADRTMPLDMTHFRAPELANLPFSEPVRHGPGTQVIDLQFKPDWRDDLWTCPHDGDQGWENRPGMLNRLDGRAPVVLRCPVPDDPYLQDQIKVLDAQGYKVTMERHPSAGEMAERVANKSPATAVEQRMREGRRNIVCVNSQTLDHVLADIDYIDENNLPARRPSLLVTAGMEGEEPPLVFISDDLSDTEWMRLMLAPSAFSVAAAAHVKPMEMFADRIHVLPPEPLPPQKGVVDLSLPVNLIHTSDVGLTSRSIGGSKTASIIHITKEIPVEELLVSFDVQYGHPDHFMKLYPKFMQLFKDLQQGKMVCLYGLETNPVLDQLLAPLLHPPHYLLINGQRYRFPQTETEVMTGRAESRPGDTNPDKLLMGRLAVFSDKQDFLHRYRQSPQFEDRFANRDEWKKLCLFQMSTRKEEERYARLEATALTDRMTRLEQLHTLAQDSGLQAPETVAFNFERFDMLCRYLFNHPQQCSAPMRSLYQDMLIGRYMRVDRPKDPGAQERMRLGLRMLFPKQMEYLGRNQVDGPALQQLLVSCHHIKDFESLTWKLLNCIDLSTVCQLFAEVCPHDQLTNDPKTIVPLLAKLREQGNATELTNRLLRLISIFAEHNNISLKPLLMRACSGLHARTSAGPLQWSAGLQVMSTSELNSRKAALLAEGGTMVFAEGPPGAGKTHAMASNAKGRIFKANARQIGTPAFNEAIREWITTPGAELWLDEADLASPRALSFFQSLLDNRTLILDGVRYALPAENVLKAAGNGTALTGRTGQAFLDAIPTQRYESFEPDELRTLFLEPMVRKAFGLGGDPLQGNAKVLSTVMLVVHSAFAKAFPEQGYSQRHLEEFSGQMLAYISRHPQLTSPSDCLPHLLRFALECYGSTLPEESRLVCRTWLAQQFGIASDAPAPLDVSVDLSTSNLAPTAATQTLCDRLRWRMEAAATYRHYTNRASTPGQSLIIIQGPPAAGKDDAVRATLNCMGWKDCPSAVADLKKIDEIYQQARMAYELDTPFLLSESNMIDSSELEARFNNLLTGQEGEPGQPAKRNFCIIGTENSLSLEGRSERSSALNNRAYTIHAQASAPEDTHAIVLRKAQEILFKAEPVLPGTQEANLSAQQRLVAQARAAAPAAHLPTAEFLENFSAVHRKLLEILSLDESSRRPGPRQIAMFLRQVMVAGAGWQEALDDIYGSFIGKAASLLERRRASLSVEEDVEMEDAPAKSLADLDAIIGHGAQHFAPPAAASTDRQPTTRQVTDMSNALRQIWRMSNPEGSTEPEFKVYGKYRDEDDRRPDVLYDTVEHRVTAHLGSMAEWEQVMRLFSGRIQQGLPFTNPISRQWEGNLESSESLERTTAMASQRRTDGGASFAPDINVDPGGHGEVRGNIGSVSGAPASAVLASTRRSAGGQPPMLVPGQQYEARHERWHPQGHGEAIDVNIDGISAHANGRFYLPTLLHMRPVGIQIGGYESVTSGLDQFGNWYFTSPQHLGGIESCTYKLINAPALRFQRQAPDHRFDLGLHPMLQQDIEALRRQQLDIRTTVEELRQLFRNHFDYDMDFEVAAEADLTDTLLASQKGVCQHFAVAGAAILQQVFGIDAHVIGGNPIANGKISADEHAVTYCVDETGTVFQADFTVPRRSQFEDQDTDWETNQFDKLARLHHGQESLDDLFHPETFDAAMLGLVKRKVSNGKISFNNAGLGQLSPAMLARRAPQPFMKLSSGSTIEHRPVYFVDFPKNLPDGMTISGFAVMLIPALEALHQWNDGAIKIHHPRKWEYDGDSAKKGARMVPMVSAAELYRMGQPDATLFSSGIKDENALIIKDDEASMEFLHRLLSHYLETMLEGEDVTLDDRHEVFTAIKDVLGACMEITPHLPVHFYIHGEKWTFTRKDAELADISLLTAEDKSPLDNIKKLMNRIAYHYQECGDFAEDSPIVLKLEEYLQSLENQNLLTGSSGQEVAEVFRDAARLMNEGDVLDHDSVFERLGPWMQKLDVDYRALSTEDDEAMTANSSPGLFGWQPGLPVVHV